MSCRKLGISTDSDGLGEFGDGRDCSTDGLDAATCTKHIVINMG